jgi:hypothetical protein
LDDALADQFHDIVVGMKVNLAASVLCIEHDPDVA